MKTKKAMKELIIKVPVKYLKGDKVWVVEEEEKVGQVECDKCDHIDSAFVWAVKPVKIVGYTFYTDNDYKSEGVSEYKVSSDEYYCADELYPTEEAANKEAAKRNK